MHAYFEFDFGYSYGIHTFCRFNALWGQLFKAGLHDSRFAKQVQKAVPSHLAFIRSICNGVSHAGARNYMCI